jgi:hypothetical protein
LVHRNREPNTATFLSSMMFEGTGPSLAVEGATNLEDILRTAGARTREALVEAMGQPISAVSARDAQDFCDYWWLQLASNAG